jgi:methionyl-tRNA formyltransferase
MRIICLANNRVGYEVLRWLVEQRADIVGLVLHPAHKRKYGDEMQALVNLPDKQIFLGSDLRKPDTVAAIKELNPDIALSIFFDYILKPAFIDLFADGVINLHPSYLPYNRGQYPNVWSIVENTPAGVTLHYIDPGIDTGDIIAQQEVPVYFDDTGRTLYQRLERACIQLFQTNWPLLMNGQLTRTPQNPEGGTYHRTKDVEKIDNIDLDATYLARDLINILRARTFPPYPGAYIEADGHRIYLRLQLLNEDEL